MSEIRIGDITQDPEEQKKLNAIFSALERFVGDEISKRSANWKNEVEEIVNGAIKRYQTVASGEPVAVRHHACLGELFNAMRVNASPSATMQEIVRKYPDMYPGLDENSVLGVVSRTTLTTGSTGMSYVLPVPTRNEIVEYAKEFIPLRQICRVMELGDGMGNSGVIPVGTANRPTCYIVNEGVAPSDSDIQPSGFQYSLLGFAVGVALSDQLWTGAVPAFTEWVIREAAYGLILKQWTQFAVGSNSSQWEGLETASITEVTGTRDDDKIVNTFTKLPAYHLPRAAWFMSENTWAAINNLRDANGQRLLPVDLAKNELRGKPVYTNSAMTDGKVYFGDPSCYIVVVRGYMTAVISPGNGWTATSTRSHYVYVGELCDGGVLSTNAWRRCTITIS